MKLYTKQNKLTAYALHCGYVSTKNNISIMVEHGMYKVQTYNDEYYFNTLKQARQKRSNLIKAI